MNFPLFHNGLSEVYCMSVMDFRDIVRDTDSFQQSDIDVAIGHMNVIQEITDETPEFANITAVVLSHALRWMTGWIAEAKYSQR